MSFARIRFPALLLIVIALAGWPSLDIDELGKNIATSTGLVTGSQVDALLKAGGKLDQATDTLTDEQEYYLGRSVSALILRQFPLDNSNPEKIAYVNQIGNALAAKSSRPEIFGGYHFAILATDQINALSAPGGFIFVSKGLLALMPNEDALASVLAHEIGHVILGHGVKAISQGRLSEAALILGKEAVSSYGPSELGMVTEVFGDSVNQVFDTIMKTGYSRGQEYEADAFAVNLMAKTGYEAKALNLMLDQIATAQAHSRGGWMDTHPSPADRKASVKLPRQTVEGAGVTARNARFEKFKG